MVTWRERIIVNEPGSYNRTALIINSGSTVVGDEGV